MLTQCVYVAGATSLLFRPLSLSFFFIDIFKESKDMQVHTPLICDGALTFKDFERFSRLTTADNCCSFAASLLSSFQRCITKLHIRFPLQATFGPHQDLLHLQLLYCLTASFSTSVHTCSRDRTKQESSKRKLLKAGGWALTSLTTLDRPALQKKQDSPQGDFNAGHSSLVINFSTHNLHLGAKYQQCWSWSALLGLRL